MVTEGKERRWVCLVGEKIGRNGWDFVRIKHWRGRETIERESGVSTDTKAKKGERNKGNEFSCCCLGLDEGGYYQNATIVHSEVGK